MELKIKTMFTEEPIDLGLPGDSDDDLLEIGAMLATFDPHAIVFAEGKLPKLQTWRGTDG